MIIVIKEIKLRFFIERHNMGLMFTKSLDLSPIVQSSSPSRLNKGQRKKQRKEKASYWSNRKGEAKDPKADLMSYLLDKVIEKITFIYFESSIID